jgi:hypothetical protein
MVKVNGSAVVLPEPSLADQLIILAPTFNCFPANDPVPLKVVAPLTEYDNVAPEQLSTTAGSNSVPLII